MIPLNDSIGLTLNCDDLSSTTTISFGKEQQQDAFVLNGKTHAINKRMLAVLGTVRTRARTTPRFQKMSDYEWQQHHFFIDSANSFPSASGMASSASGFACLAAALNHLFGSIFSN
jgi:diphosphomevalonate decarboxylase